MPKEASVPPAAAAFRLPIVLTDAVRPRGPYSLALSARLAGDATRSFRDGRFVALLDLDGAVERVLARLRFVLALDHDHTPFLREFAEDRLLGRALHELRGLRPVRAATVAHALL